MRYFHGIHAHRREHVLQEQAIIIVFVSLPSHFFLLLFSFCLKFFFKLSLIASWVLLAVQCIVSLSSFNILNISFPKSLSERLYIWLTLTVSSELLSSLTKCGGILHCYPIVMIVVWKYLLIVVAHWLREMFSCFASMFLLGHWPGYKNGASESQRGLFLSASVSLDCLSSSFCVFFYYYFI